jgi:hypothetical protein
VYVRGGGVAAVVKVEVKSELKALPARSFIAAVAVTVYEVSKSSGDVGEKVALLPEQLTLPETGPPAEASMKLDDVTVAQLIVSEKFNETVVVTAIFTAVLTGTTFDTVGGVLSVVGFPPPPPLPPQDNIKTEAKMIANPKLPIIACILFMAGSI